MLHHLLRARADTSSSCAFRGLFVRGEPPKGRPRYLEKCHLEPLLKQLEGDLDEGQRVTLRSVYDKFVLLQGPPGTGKSVMAARLVKAKLALRSVVHYKRQLEVSSHVPRPGKFRMAIHRRRSAPPPPPGPPPLDPPPPPPDQSDHRGEERNLRLGKSGRAIFGTQIWVPDPPPLPSILVLPCPRPTSPAWCRMRARERVAGLSPLNSTSDVAESTP